MNTQAALWLGLVLLLGNAFFVGAEFALVSARRTKVEPKAAEGSRVARTTLRAMENLSQMIAAAQFGITVCSLGLGAVAEPALAHLIEPVAQPVHLPDSWLHPVAFTIAMTFVVYLHVVLGEMVPKNLALAGPERAAMVLGPPMVAIVALLKPIVYGLDALANVVVRLFKVEPRSEVISTFTLEEVEAMVDESHDEGMLDQSEYERLAGALGFTSRTVDDVLLPLDRLETVERGARASDVEVSVRTPATPASRWSETTASWSATCTSRTSCRPTRTAAPGWSRTSGSARSPRCASRTRWSGAADAAGPGRAHGPRGRRRPRGAGCRDPRGRHRGAGRRDPRRGSRRRSLISPVTDGARAVTAPMTAPMTAPVTACPWGPPAG